MVEFDRENLVDYSIDFYQIYPDYKSLFKKIPSNYMWSLLYLYHPNSPLRELNYKRKLDEINRIAPSSFDPEKYPDDAKRFQELVTTYAQRYIQRWRKKLDERADFKDSIPYSEETLTINENLLKNEKTIWDAYRQAEAELSKEDSFRISGDQEESAVEKGLI